MLTSSLLAQELVTVAPKGQDKIFFLVRKFFVNRVRRTEDQVSNGNGRCGVSWRLKSYVILSRPLSLSCPKPDVLQERRVLALKIVVIVSLVAASSTESLFSFFVYSSKDSEHVQKMMRDL